MLRAKSSIGLSTSMAIHGSTVVDTSATSAMTTKNVSGIQAKVAEQNEIQVRIPDQNNASTSAMFRPWQTRNTKQNNGNGGISPSFGAGMSRSRSRMGGTKRQESSSGVLAALTINNNVS